MDLYVLDEQLRRTAIIDRYKSLIWTERYSEHGEFQLVVRSDRGVRNLLTPGTRVAIVHSNYIMVVDTIEKSANNGDPMLTVRGRSLEIILEDRSNRRSFSGSSSAGTLELTQTPGNIARQVFDLYCRNNTLIPEDNIPFLMPGTLLPAGSIAEPAELVTMSFEPESVYASIKKVCDLYNLGFRLIRNGDAGELYFEIYTGYNRTSLQTVNTPVIFSPELDNLSDTNELTSTAAFKNVAYVIGKNGSRVVYADGVESTISGFDRRTLTVKADDIDLAPGLALDAALEQRGKEELGKHRVAIGFDGEIPQYGYIYGEHYGLGDLVEQRNDDGLATNMRVTEQIFVSDEQGVRSYPTLTIDLLITPGSWYAWDANQVWDDATGYWADA